MIRKVLFLSLAITLFTLGTASAAEHYVNGIDADYPPFASVDAAGKAQGFDVEAMDWIAKKMGFTVEHKAMEWGTIVSSLVDKKIDMVASGMSITPERKAAADFSAPYWSVRKYLLVQTDSTLTKDDLLKGNKKLGVQEGSNEAATLKELAAKEGWNFELKSYDSPMLAIEDLAKGNIDGAAVDSAPATAAMDKDKKPVKVIGEFAEPEDFGVAVRKGESALLEKINEGYKLLRQDPYWDELKDKYINPAD